MCLGYPKRIALVELVNKLEPIRHEFKYIPNSFFYPKILLLRGFGPNDFIFGKEIIFFRSTKSDLVKKMFHDLKESSEDTLKKIKKALLRSIWRRLFVFIKSCLAFNGKQIKFEFHSEN